MHEEWRQEDQLALVLRNAIDDTARDRHADKVETVQANGALDEADILGGGINDVGIGRVEKALEAVPGGQHVPPLHRTGIDVFAAEDAVVLRAADEHVGIVRIGGDAVKLHGIEAGIAVVPGDAAIVAAINAAVTAHENEAGFRGRVGDDMIIHVHRAVPGSEAKTLPHHLEVLAVGGAVQLDIADIDFVAVLRIHGDAEIIAALIDLAIAVVAAQTAGNLPPVVAVVGGFEHARAADGLEDDGVEGRTRARREGEMNPANRVAGGQTATAPCPGLAVVS